MVGELRIFLVFERGTVNQSFKLGRIEQQMDLSCLEGAHGKIENFGLFGYGNFIASFTNENASKMFLILSHSKSIRCKSSWIVQNPILRRADDCFVFEDENSLICFDYGELISEEIWIQRSDFAESAILDFVIHRRTTKAAKLLEELIVDRLIWDSTQQSLTGLIGGYRKVSEGPLYRHAIPIDGRYFGALQLNGVTQLDVSGDWHPMQEISIRAVFDSQTLIMEANRGCVRISFCALGIISELDIPTRGL